MFYLCFVKVLPAHVVDHDSEDRIHAKSCQKPSLRHSKHTGYTHSGPVYGTWKLQSRFEKCVFSVYGPSLKAPFARMCSIACILDSIFKLSPRVRPHFAKKLTSIEIHDVTWCCHKSAYRIWQFQVFHDFQQIYQIFTLTFTKSSGQSFSTVWKFSSVDALHQQLWAKTRFY